jgi:V8-like Glu-specific endopeptidase
MPILWHHAAARYAVIAVLSLSACVDIDAGTAGDPEVLSEESAVSGPGTVVVPRGDYPAVVRVQHESGSCTGTLISPDAVLTASGCVCRTVRRDCPTRSAVVFESAHRHDGQSAPVEIQGDIVYASDPAFALIKLDVSPHELVDVAPIRVAGALPVTGDIHTQVGYGNAAFGDPTCFASSVLKKGATAVQVLRFGDRWYLEYDRSVATCMPGDYGAPAINERGEIVGVHGSDDLTKHNPTYYVWNWLRQNACAPYDPDAGLEQCSAMCPCASAQGECDGEDACRPGAVCVADTGAQAGLPADTDVCWSQHHVVTVYRDSHYGGPAQHITIGQWDVAALTVGNDAISSLDAAPGLSIRLFAEGGCWGENATFAGNTPRIGAPMDDRASCVRVSPGVTVYAGPGFSGARSTFEIGGYNHTSLHAPGNDDIQSLKATPGIVVRLCSESGAPGTVGRGTCTRRGDSVADLGANAGISNLEVAAGVTVYAHPSFQGPSATFGIGVVGPADLAALHDEISSLVVGPGLVARACSETQGGGDCETFTGWHSFVGTALADRISWIQVRRPVPLPTIPRP